MASELEIVAKVFGAKELVAGLDEFGKDVRRRVFFSLKSLAQVYASDVMTTGLAEQGIKPRTGRLQRSMRTPAKLGDSYARVLIYPNATDPTSRYRYPWALGKGSPKNEIMVKGHARASPDRSTYSIHRKRRGSKLGVAQAVAVQTSSGITFVKQHRRKIRMKPRPFMSGGAFTRLQAAFAGRMEAAIRQAIQDAKVMQTVGQSDYSDPEVY